jgi:hypothetical protein
MGWGFGRVKRGFSGRIFLGQVGKIWMSDTHLDLPREPNFWEIIPIVGKF